MSRCRSCGARITWAPTERTRTAIPLQPDPAGNLLIRHGLAVAITGTVAPREGERRYVTHFATCPDRDQWRRKA